MAGMGRQTAAGTITVDTEEPLDLNDQPVWPEHKPDGQRCTCGGSS